MHVETDSKGKQCKTYRPADIRALYAVPKALSGAERYLPLEVTFAETNRAAYAQIDHEAAGRIVFSG